MARPSSKEAIIDAAEDLVYEVGPSHLTLEAVAERAGLSKGGLLYHFPTKEALLGAMIHRCIEHYHEARAACERELPDSPCKGLRAHLAAATRVRDERSRRVSSAMLAVIANNRDLLVPIQERFRSTFDPLVQCEGKLNPDAAVLCLAAEGLMLLEMLGFDPFGPDDRSRVIARMLELATKAT